MRALEAAAFGDVASTSPLARLLLHVVKLLCQSCRRASLDECLSANLRLRTNRSDFRNVL